VTPVVSPHESALACLARWTAPDPEQEQLRTAYVSHLRRHPDGVWRTCTPDHLTASLIVLSPEADRALLTLHAKAGRWFQLGGHLEAGDDSLAEAALREGREEGGIEALTLVGDGPLLLDAHPAPCATVGAERHLDVQYLATTPANGRPMVSDESLDVRWFAVDDLPPGCDASVRALVAAGVRRLSAQASSSDSPRLAAVENPSR
jgi:8-oxo-dGTP pyrophosphatase MutT (NUDIX family)